MAIKLPSYLHRNRHGIFGFRLVVPTRLRCHFEAKQYRFSLGTANKNRAKSLALKLASLTWQTYLSMSQMSEDDGKRAARDLLKSINAELDADVAIPPELALLRQTLTLDQLKAYARKTVEGLPNDPINSKFIEIAIELAERGQALKAWHQAISQRALDSANSDRALFEDDELYASYQAEVYEYLTELSDFERDQHALELALSRVRMQQQYEEERSRTKDEHESRLNDVAKFASQIMSYVPAAPTAVTAAAPRTPSPTTPATAPASSKAKEIMLSAVIDAFCDNRVAEKSWSAKTEAENRAIYTLWLDIVGDQPIETYGYEQHEVEVAPI